MNARLSPPLIHTDLSRFYLLDVLRGLAALCVVFSHWKHFFFNGGIPSNGGYSQYPFYVIFNQIYERGGDGIHVFFCLSGFVFYWMYSDRISNREIKPSEFWILRFSRLWPLHAVTMMLVVALQQLYWPLQHDWLVYNEDGNNVYNFFLHLIFAGAWGIQNAGGYNGPSWTVSIEVLLYGVFFVVCSFGFKRWWSIALIAIAGLAVNLAVSEFTEGRYMGPCNSIASAVMMFFLGGLLFKLFLRLSKNAKLAENWDAIAVILVALWVLIFLGWPVEFTAWIYSVAFLKPQLVWTSADVQAVLQIYGLVFKLLFVPFTVLSLALIQRWNKNLGKRWEWLGDISYSSYLLHFPLQIAFVCVTMESGYNTAQDHSVFYSPWMLLGFFVVLLICSYLSFRFFERPVQERIRECFSIKKSRSQSRAHSARLHQ